MALTPGTRLGPYEIIGALGAGGMGEVYRARDARLNRDVAIKTLPAAFAADAQRMARFQREAQVLAALSHQNIAAIFGIEEGALVMELVEGLTLAERIEQGPLPVEEALAIARQIAAALDAAHGKGIVHRDLKPANVKIDGAMVKVLDFGLAKAFDAESTLSGDLNNSPTLTLEATRAGTIMGTAGYMSPEQARGKPVDKRADIWAFGVVLYEMLTGLRTFDGETVSDSLAAILKSDPDWKALPAGTPPKVVRLLQRCLERDPNRRLRDIGDAWIEIDSPDAPAPTAAAPPPATPSGMRWAPGIAGALLAALAIAWALLHAPATAPRPVMRSVAVFKDFIAYPALSRDGTRLTYTELANGKPRITLRMMDQLEAKPIAGAENSGFSTFSPDGQWLVYTSFGDNKVKKIPATGGAAVTLCDGTTSFGAVWGDDNQIVFATQKGLMRVSAAGGTPQPLTTVDTKKGEVVHRSPWILPGGKAILFTITTASGFQIAVLDLKNTTQQVLVNNGTEGRYVPAGYLVYARGATLLAAPFDPERMTLTGPEFPAIDAVDNNGTPGTANYTFADSGTLVYIPGVSRQQGTTLSWADRKGALQPLAPEPRLWGTGRLSPDGRLLANGIGKTGTSDVSIWSYEVARGALVRLTFEGVSDNPVWTPDSRRVAYSVDRQGKTSVDWVKADGSAKPERLIETERIAIPSSWTPDGKTLLYTLTGPTSRIMVLPVADGGAQAPHPLHDANASEDQAAISRGGRWVAYVSSESGTREVYVQPFPGPGAKVRVSLNGGEQPRWSPNGKELFYWELRPNRQLMSVDVLAAAEFRAGVPQLLFNLASGSTWDVTPDGKRFLVELVTVPNGGTFALESVTEWFEELKRAASGKR